MKIKQTMLPLAMAPLLVLFAVSASAQQVPAGGDETAPGNYNLVVKAGAGYTDNVERSGTDGTSSLLGIVGVEMLVRKETGRLQLSGGLDLSLLHYFDAVRDADQIVGGGNVRGRYEIADDRLFWVLEDTFSQVREDFRLPTSPNNRQNLNYLTTGPDFSWALTPTVNFTSELRYTRRDADAQSQLNSQSYLARLLLTRNFGPRSSLSLAGSGEKFDVDADATLLNNQQDFDRREYFLRWLVGTTRTNLSVEGGVSEIAGGTRDESGPLFRVAMRRVISPALTLNLSGARQFAVTGEVQRDFRLNETLSLSDDLILPAAEPYEQTQARADLEFRRPRTGATLSYVTTQEDYSFVAQFERETTDISASVLRRLNPRSELRFRAGYTTDEIKGQPYNVKDKYFGAALRWRLTRAVSFSAAVDRRARSGGVFSDNYTELYGSLQIRYSPFGPDSGIEMTADPTQIN
ncbi:MAG TPA: hypothetical protein P5528_09300 [Steroidobacteraceae bacterium]|nr:hypothetical protein [Steroidobacteraceae bacterium]HRX89628.1 hypothetical protein [Steroidobacteraceae bacterium]